MMTITQFYLGKVAEEAIEIAKEALKAQQFGLSEHHPERTETNAQRICAELNDLLAMVHQLGSVSNGEFYFSQDGFAQAAKLAKVEKYLAYSQSLGLVETAARRFRNKNGFCDDTAYIQIQHTGDVYLVKRNGFSEKTNAYDLDRCLSYVASGDWIELEAA